MGSLKRTQSMDNIHHDFHRGPGAATTERVFPVTKNRILKRTQSMEKFQDFHRGPGAATTERCSPAVHSTPSSQISGTCFWKPVNPATFLVILIILMKVSSGLSLTCHQAEYQIGNECCPKCLAGRRVETHCNENESTSCLPCMDGTFTDEPNGLERCITCTDCDSGSGLRVKTECTATSDTVCEPLEGFYCVSFVGLSCDIAQKHKRCKPGQYISQKGTASTDTECSDCSNGTFSDGTFHSCQPHTQCHSLIAAGTAEADAQCGETSDHVTLTVILVFVFIIAVVSGLLCYRKRGFLIKWSQTNNTPTDNSIPQQATDRSPPLLAPTEPPVEALREPPMALKSNSQNSLPMRGRTRGDGSEREAELELVLVNGTHRETDREQAVT